MESEDVNFSFAVAYLFKALFLSLGMLNSSPFLVLSLWFLVVLSLTQLIKLRTSTRRKLP